MYRLTPTYIETDPTDSVQLKAFQTAAAALNPTATQIVALDALGAVEKVDCTDRTKLVEALQRDTSASGTYKHGSCCLNSHTMSYMPRYSITDPFKM